MTSTEGPPPLETKATDGPQTHVTETPAGEQSGPSTEVESKLRRRALKRIEDDRRPLDSWELYRALNDAMDEAYELIDIANREARFSLILMGALNVVLFVVGTRTELVQSLPSSLRPWIAVVLVVYALVALYFFLQAIETLRPRRFRPRLQGLKRKILRIAPSACATMKTSSVVTRKVTGRHGVKFGSASLTRNWRHRFIVSL